MIRQKKDDMKMIYIQKKKMLSFLCVGVFFLFVFFISSSYAQTELSPPLSEVSSTDIDALSAPSLDLVVSAGGAVGTTATITAHTDYIDDNAVVFDWYLDGGTVPVLTGKAKTTFSFVTTKQSHRVHVIILSEGKKIAENTVPVHSFQVALAWHTDTFIPTDYQGKAFPSVGSQVTVVALPEIQNEKSDDLLYTWYLDAESKVRGVVGQDVFTFSVRKNIRSMSVIVEVSNPSRSIMVRHAVLIPIMKPEVILSSHKVVDVVPGDIKHIYASPFYFHITHHQELSYVWSFAGQEIVGTPPDAHLLTLSIPIDSATGVRYITLEAEDQRGRGERARTELAVQIQ